MLKKREPVLGTQCQHHLNLGKSQYSSKHSNSHKPRSKISFTGTREVEVVRIEGLVAKVSEDEVIINVGSQEGVKVNDIFNVRRIIERITDPQTGEVILERKEKTAEIKISEVYERAAIGKITLLGVGKEIEVGDLVDLQK